MTWLPIESAPKDGTRRRGILSTVERLLSNDWLVLIVFCLLLMSFRLSFLQYLMAVIVFVRFTTKPPQWLADESPNPSPVSRD